MDVSRAEVVVVDCVVVARLPLLVDDEDAVGPGVDVH